MTTNEINMKSLSNKPIRLLPGIIILILQWIIRFVIPAIVPEAIAICVLGGLAGTLAIFVWWGFFSRAPGVERWGAIVLMIAALVITSFLIDVSIATGAQGMMFYIYATPILSLAFVLWAVISKNMSKGIRHVILILIVVLACGFWTLLRIDGITGDFKLDLAWRWSETSEEKMLASDHGDLIPSTASIVVDSVASWPGFRGPNRDGIINGAQIETNWAVSPPKEIWRKSVGPGCSSFAASGNFLFTQEQRGTDELVTCYNINTGELAWSHSDEARFWDSHAGAGPRSTPTLSNGRVYTLGATGILNVLNINDGSKVWSRNAVSDTKLEHSGWGYCSSPLVIDDVVIVAVVGQLAAYDINTGEPEWFGPNGGDGYSSPHIATLCGIEQILLNSAKGIVSLNPADGSQIWEHSWPGSSRIVQPAIIKNGDLLVSGPDGNGISRLSVSNAGGKWKIEERWNSSELKPNFNDFVIHKGFAYGFSGPILACINIENGEKMWRGERYGGQIILLADQDILVILTEKGKVALVSATPEEFKELSLIDAIEGKTWNHPVIADDVLLVRNTSEMVAYRLSLTAE